DPASSFICLLKKKKELRCLEKLLAEKKEAFKERMEVIAEQWKDLSARRAQLRAYMERCEGTVQENEMLRRQALNKANKERVDNLKRENELLEAKRELEALRKKHQKLCKKLPKYFVFKRYLDDVVEMSQFQDIEEITSFYKILVRSRKELLQSQQWHEELTEKAKVLLEQYRAEKEDEMLHCKNDLVELKQYLEQARSDVPLWEDRWADIQNRAAKKAMKLRATELAIHNLFQ
ncbi:CCD42 protein, partial [Scytalopus superciliaris]|nr:CCD42 protein [Scytalopus superciliaris]